MDYTASKKATHVLDELIDTGVKMLYCRNYFIKQEVAAENLVHVDTSDLGNLPQAVTMKNETPVDERDDITVKEEPIDWNQEPQASSSAIFFALTFKREVDEACVEAQAEHTETENKVRAGGPGASNTSTVDPQSAEASRESTDSLAPDVFYANSDVEVRPPDSHVTQLSMCELCDSATVRKANLRQNLCYEHKLGVSSEGKPNSAFTLQQAHPFITELSLQFTRVFDMSNSVFDMGTAGLKTGSSGVSSRASSWLPLREEVIEIVPSDALDSRENMSRFNADKRALRTMSLALTVFGTTSGFSGCVSTVTKDYYKQDVHGHIADYDSGGQFTELNKFLVCEIHWGADPPLIKLHGGFMRPEIPPSIFNVPASCLPSPKAAPCPAKVEHQQLRYFLQKDMITSFDAFKPERNLQKQYKNLIISRSKERLVCLFMTDNFTLNGPKPNVQHLRSFGCMAYAHVPKDEREKLDSKSKTCVLVGNDGH
ncbi:hypothetical protein FHG87_008212 [Trinorchestia longiramus]|nr:hypothetical protein FHG87_008212 [Trinorchestia longiramus]